LIFSNEVLANCYDLEHAEIPAIALSHWFPANRQVARAAFRRPYFISSSRKSHRHGAERAPQCSVRCPTSEQRYGYRRNIDNSDCVDGIHLVCRSRRYLTRPGKIHAGKSRRSEARLNSAGLRWAVLPNLGRHRPASA
jgi:hypothetical protein